MHPKIPFQGEISRVFEDLARPIERQGVRLRSRNADPAKEVSLAEGYHLSLEGLPDDSCAESILSDLHHFLSVAMQIDESENGYPIRIALRRIPAAPEDAGEKHRIETSKVQTEVAAEDPEGLRRAVSYLQEEMLLRRAPILPLGEQTRWTRIKTRISRSPVAPYRWLSGWELEDENDYYPEAYLSRLARYGINGLWVPGLLRNLIASSIIPEMGPTEHRLDKLQALISRAARHGIRIYLFCIEPRILPEDHPVRFSHPEIIGAHGSLCTSNKLVLDYIRDAMQSLFREVPDLAGVINIFCGERVTHCWFNQDYVQSCPHCRKRNRSEVLGEMLNAFAEGIHTSRPTAEFMAWAYFMASTTESAPISPILEVMNEARPDVIWLGNFEHGSKKLISGREVEIHEYSLSCVGPSESFEQLADAALKRGREIYAKLQVGNSYEMSSVPYIPVPGIVYDKLEAAARLGVTGTMIGWIIGGSPSPMLGAVGACVFEPRPDKDALLWRLAAVEWGELSAAKVVTAWNHFSEAWQRYPFHNAVLYWGPITRASAYQLHLEIEPRKAKPYNWGINRARDSQPFEDDCTRWLGPFSSDEVISSFRGMAETWLAGLQLLREALRENDGSEQLKRQVAVAEAVRLQCLAAANVYEFYALRDQLKACPDANHHATLERMQTVVRDDIAVAEETLQVLMVEPLIGFQSEIYDYSYSPTLIKAKILHSQDVAATLASWQKHGVERRVLGTTVEESQDLRTHYFPDRWGD